MEETAALAVLLHGTPVSGTIPDTHQPGRMKSDQSVTRLAVMPPARRVFLLADGFPSLCVGVREAVTIRQHSLPCQNRHRELALPRTHRSTAFAESR